MIEYLRDTNTIKWEKVGKEIQFNETSIREFEKTFNRDDYLLSKECSKQLNDIGVYDKCINNRSGVLSPLGFSVSMKSLKNDTDGIFKDKKLQYVKFGNSVFVLKKSFYETKEWLQSEYDKKYPQITDEMTDEQIEEFKRKISEKRKLKRGGILNLKQKIRLGFR